MNSIFLTSLLILAVTMSLSIYMLIRNEDFGSPVMDFDLLEQAEREILEEERLIMDWEQTDFNGLGIS